MKIIRFVFFTVIVSWIATDLQAQNIVELARQSRERRKAAPSKGVLTVTGTPSAPAATDPAKAAEGTSLLVDGEKVYFCCGNCPKEYLKKLGVVRAEPGKCAVCDKKGVAANEMIVTKSEVVYFCCGNCPKGYAKKHFKDGLFVAEEKAKTD